VSKKGGLLAVANNANMNTFEP